MQNAPTGRWGRFLSFAVQCRQQRVQAQLFVRAAEIDTPAQPFREQRLRRCFSCGQHPLFCGRERLEERFQPCGGCVILRLIECGEGFGRVGTRVLSAAMPV